MQRIKIKSPQINFTPVDNEFIDKYLPDAKGEFVKVYLLCLRYGFGEIETSIEEISSTLGLLQTDVLKAFEYWEEKGLLMLSPEGFVEFIDKKNVSELSDIIYFDKFLKEMFEHLEKLIGRPMNSKEISTYMSFLDDFNFSPEVVTLLVEYCTSRKKTDIRYIEKVAIAWHDAGIKSLEDAQRHITMHEEKWNKYRAILNYLGLKDSDVSKPQEEMLEKWLIKYNLPVDVILEACRICIMRINEGNFSYIDAILSDWYKNGIKSMDDIKKINRKTKSQRKNVQNSSGINAGQSQYDMAELKRQLLGRGDTIEK